MKNPFTWLTARNTTLQQVLDNARTDHEVIDLYLQLIENGYDKYSSRDNYSENIKGWRLKCYSNVDTIRPIINGMINEIKRLEKENEALKHLGK